jgi:FtsP/CotA-like multicopper oxidase with cupredoxin domain
VVFPKEGYYCVVDASVPAGASVTRQDETAKLLGWVKVENGKPLTEDQESIHNYLKEKLIAAANNLTVDKPIKDKIVSDLGDGLKLTLFTPHRDITQEKNPGKQELTFNIEVVDGKPKFTVSNSPTNEGAKPYNSNDSALVVKLGNTDEWKLRSHRAGHPFHIHVNPFQIVAIYDPLGRDVSGEDAVDWVKEINSEKFAVPENFDPETFDPKNYPGVGKIDPEYRGLKGVWRDTIWLKGPVEDKKVINLLERLPDWPGSNPEMRNNKYYTIVMRTHYERFPGTFVLHCHILDHEDEGMMQKVSIVE